MIVCIKVFNKMADDGESLSERQEFEVQALKAIYDNDFEVCR